MAAFQVNRRACAQILSAEPAPGARQRFRIVITGLIR